MAFWAEVDSARPSKKWLAGLPEEARRNVTLYVPN
jgi:hypothetical protein